MPEYSIQASFKRNYRMTVTAQDLDHALGIAGAVAADFETSGGLDIAKGYNWDLEEFEASEADKPDFVVLQNGEDYLVTEDAAGPVDLVGEPYGDLKELSNGDAGYCDECGGQIPDGQMSSDIAGRALCPTCDAHLRLTRPAIF